MKCLFFETLKTLLKHPIVILMLGDWRTGKTDTSLLTAYLAKKWKLIDKIGSNIWTFNNPEVEYITTTGKLRNWLHSDKSTKLFILDEGLKHIFRRTAMSHKNVETLQILTELSKGHGRVIICSQIGQIDKDIIHPAFCRAVFIKRSKKVMECRSKHFFPRTFTGLPKSPIRFDPDRVAEFIDRKMSKKAKNPRMEGTYKICKLYVEGKSMTKISNELGYHREEIRRHLKKGLVSFLEHEGALKEEDEVNEVPITNL